MNQFMLEEEESRAQMGNLGLTESIIEGIILGGAQVLGVGGAVATQVMAGKQAAAAASAARKLQAAEMVEAARNRAAAAQIAQAQMDFEAQKIAAQGTITSNVASNVVKGAIIIGVVGVVGLLIYGGLKYRSSRTKKA
jgi:hypothetical protein